VLVRKSGTVDNPLDFPQHPSTVHTGGQEEISRRSWPGNGVIEAPLRGSVIQAATDWYGW